MGDDRNADGKGSPVSSPAGRRAAPLGSPSGARSVCFAARVP